MIKIFLIALLINNVVLMRFIALCSYIGMTSDVGQSVGMGFAVTFVTVLATAATWPLYHFVLVPLDLEFLQILVFILVIAALVQLVEFYLKKNVPGLYAAMGIYLPLITTNCAILAVTFENISNDYTFIESIVYAVGVSARLPPRHDPPRRRARADQERARCRSSSRARRSSSSATSLIADRLHGLLGPDQVREEDDA